MPSVLQSTNASFHPEVPNLQLIWDSTSLTALKECPFKYYLSIICGYEPRAESIHLKFGLAYHSALEEYDRRIAQGEDEAQALREAVRRAMLDVRGIPEDSNKNPFTLVRTVVWYIDHFKDSSLQTVVLSDGRPAVELHFRFDSGITASDGSPFELVGHLDKIATTGQEEFILDRKTTKYTLSASYFSKYLLDNQMSLYSIAGKVAYHRKVSGVLIDAAQIAVTFSRFGRGPAHRTEPQLEEWLRDLPTWLSQAEAYARANNWPMNDSACNHYGGCKFREICSKSPAVRQSFLNSNFRIRTWDPTKERGV